MSFLPPRSTDAELREVLSWHQTNFPTLRSRGSINEPLWMDMMRPYPKERLQSGISLIKRMAWDEITRPYGLDDHVSVLVAQCAKQEKSEADKRAGQINRNHWKQVESYQCLHCRDSGYRSIHEPKQMMRILAKMNPDGLPPDLAEKHARLNDRFTMMISCSVCCTCHQGKQKADATKISMFGDERWHLPYESILTDDQFFEKVHTHLKNTPVIGGNSILTEYTQGALIG